MKRTPAKAVSLVLVLVMLLSLLTVGAAAEESGWWTEEVWDTETLVSLGAKPPVYNKSTGCYEIGTPEQLLYLSGAWKSADTNGDGYPDGPRDGPLCADGRFGHGPADGEDRKSDHRGIRQGDRGPYGAAFRQ